MSLNKITQYVYMHAAGLFEYITHDVALGVYWWPVDSLRDSSLGRWWKLM